MEATPVGEEQKGLAPGAVLGQRLLPAWLPGGRGQQSEGGTERALTTPGRFSKSGAAPPTAPSQRL